MDPRERFEDHQEALRTAMDGQQAGMWTAMPATVTAYDPARMTVSATPAIKAKQRQLDGTQTDVLMPPCVDVPVVFPRGGGFSLTFPIAVGDEVLLVFASRCIDGWWQEGGTQPQLDARMHDLSDAFAIPGPWSQKTKITGALSGAQLRNAAGTTVVEVSADTITLAAAKVRINSADVIVAGASLKHNAKNVGDTHTHTDPQGGSTGAPT